MEKESVIAIFDVGKTNKKLLLFNEQYKLVHEESKKLTEIKDEDDFPCEDVEVLTNWVKDSFASIEKDRRFNIKAVNFSGYGASFIYLDEKGKPFLPLYNYLKPYPEELQQQFYNKYGGENLVAKQTASPVLGNLNSGMQLYRLKYEKEDSFTKIKYALHLPQYLSYILCGQLSAEITSIGCHTTLWHFEKDQYHNWVEAEGVLQKFPAIKDSSVIAGFTETGVAAGVGLHDSSAALIPYLSSFNEPFILLSTGTWSISLNPFNHSPLTDDELKQDCLCYLSYQDKPVKASRLLAGYEHDEFIKKLTDEFAVPIDHYKNIDTVAFLSKEKMTETYEGAYYQFIKKLIDKQVKSTDLILKNSPAKKIFVDGGFSKNPIFMELLAEAYPDFEVYAASVPHGSALGAALTIHQHWNSKAISPDIIDLKLFTPAAKI